MTISGKFGDPKTERDILSAKRFNFFALIVLVLAIAAAFLIYLQLLNKQRELETKSQELADSTANLRRIRGELEAAQRSLSLREQQMELQLQSLSSSVENRQFDSAMVKASAINSQLAHSDSTGLTVVQLYAWKPRPGMLPRITSYLSNPEFIVASDSTLLKLPSWMGKQSAVHYYRNESATRAQEIANGLTQITGEKFLASPGNLHDAPARSHHQWLHIYYLGASALANQK